MDLQRLKIGRTGDFQPVYIKGKDRYLGTLLIGKSGTGKSTEILNWVRDDSFWPYSKVVIEPSGFLAQDCRAIIKGKVHYCSLDTPVALNPMLAPYSPDTISETIAECINQVIQLTTPNDNLTSKMRVILDEKIKYCLERNRKSLLYVRDEIAKMTTNTETTSGILSRLNFLLSDERMEKILCNQKSIQWGKMIQDGDSFLLDAFGMGREKMVFCGNLVAQQIKNYFRYERPKVYKPVVVYIDELRNFINLNYLDILNEARKFLVSLVMACQNFAAIDEKLVRVLLNVGNICAYRLGAKEAQMIAMEMRVEAEMIQFLEKYHLAYLTPKECGVAKAPFPPLVPKKSAKIPVVSKPKTKSHGWFEMEPSEPATT